jgi:hypothetical protein
METLTTSIKQLVIETITFIHAKRLGLAKHYFEARKAKSD